MDVAQRDRLYLSREEAAEGMQIARSQGGFLFDQHSKKYLDFTAGWCVGNLGWGNEEIRAAVRDFDGPTYVHPDYLYRGWANLKYWSKHRRRYWRTWRRRGTFFGRGSAR